MSHTYEKAFHLGLGAILASVMLASGVVSCGGSDDADDGTDTGGSLNAGGSSANAGGSSANAGGSTNTGGTTGTIPPGVCSNGMDDDGDDLIDDLDPECTGPLDDDEGTFATGIPGDNRDPFWQDCFFDGNSGPGDDKCRYHTDCLYGILPADDEDCVLSADCVEFCAERTPNGCDCFGCCTVQRADGTDVDILTGTDCSIAQVDDPDACPPCMKTTDCGNDCGTCELCLGKTVDDLPPECAPPETDGGVPPPGYTCNDGQAVCGADLPECPAGRYCVQGCCIIAIQ